MTTLGPGTRRRLNDELRKVDHAADGYIHRVKDQGGCGSCWAFAANTASEGTLAKKTNNKNVRHISEQHLVDCTLSVSSGGKKFDRQGDNLGPIDYNGWGCNGAWMEYAWRFQRDHGAMLEEDYPYASGRTGTPGKECKHD